jgi:DDE family transposase
VVRRSFDEGFLERVRAYRGTFPYEKALRKRGVWVEPLFAEAKEWHGMRRFRLRRLEKVNAEALMIASGQNVKRLVTFGRGGPRKIAMAALRPPEELPSRPLRRHRAIPAWRYFNRLRRSEKFGLAPGDSAPQEHDPARREPELHPIGALPPFLPARVGADLGVEPHPWSLRL